MGGVEEGWDDPSKPAEFLRSADEWHHVRPSSGRREREARPSLLHSLSRGVQRIQPIIALFLAQTLWVWRHGPCSKMRRPFVFPISKLNKNPGFSHVESGNRDTPKFVLKNRDIPIKSG